MNEDCQPQPCRHVFRDGTRCTYCNVSIDTLKQKQRDDLLRFALEEHGEDSWSTTLRACLDLISAIDGGATLVVAGPDRTGQGPVSRTFGATLESVTGARCANAYATDFRTLVVELLREWQQQLPHASPSSHGERPTP